MACQCVRPPAVEDVAHLRPLFERAGGAREGAVQLFFAGSAGFFFCCACCACFLTFAVFFGLLSPKMASRWT